MTRPLAILRPEPGNTATAARVEALGLAALRLPLFAVRPIAWSVPDPAAHDAILFTSANAPRHGGGGLARFAALPAYAIGAATAAAARDAGFAVTASGDGDWRALYALAAARGVRRALLLTGRERAALPASPVAAIVPVYASDPIAMPPSGIARLAGSVALLHSVRAAVRLAEIASVRSTIRIAALSSAVHAAAGDGWAGSVIAPRPDDDALIAAACRLAD